MTRWISDVRYYPNSRHRPRHAGCLLRAKKRHSRRSKTARYSITSSAVNKSFAGISSPSARHRIEPHRSGSAHKATSYVLTGLRFVRRVQPALAQKVKLLAHDSKTHAGFGLNPIF
jgi:hypothetical protein